jgi:hypothetical protein
MTRRLIGITVLMIVSAVPLRAQTPRLELTIGGSSVLAKRNEAFGTVVGSGTATMTGLELTARAGWFRLSGRIINGTFGADSGGTPSTQVTSAEAGVGLGARVFSVEAGYGRRAFTAQLGTQVYAYGRIGARSVIDLGSTGLAVTIAGADYLDLKSVPGATIKGAEGETALVWTPSRIPVYASVGYRFEQFTVGTDAGDRPDEISGLTVGAGLRLAH